jgi:hypothetical protein
MILVVYGHEQLAWSVRLSGGDVYSASYVHFVPDTKSITKKNFHKKSRYLSRVVIFNDNQLFSKATGRDGKEDRIR